VVNQRTDNTITKRYHRGNHNPQIEGQTTQRTREKQKRTNNVLQSTTLTSKD
jgi:hypothetical protein